MQERSVFKNIVKMTKDSGYQLKFKLKGAEYQPYAPSISDAISLRNKYYLSENYRPNHLYKKFFTLDCLTPSKRVEKSGNTTLRWQVHSRVLETSEYKPKGFNDHDLAADFARRWMVSYNAIVSIYNAWREEKFLVWIEQEAKEEIPHIDTNFDKELWRNAAHQVFGLNVPEYFTEQEELSPIWIPDYQHKFTSKEMGYGKESPRPKFRSKKVAEGFTASIRKEPRTRLTGEKYYNYTPGFFVTGAPGSRRGQFIRITPERCFMKAYMEAVDAYSASKSLSPSESRRLLAKCPPKEIFYLDYKRWYDAGDDISIVDILEKLELSDFNLENLKVSISP
ncbi:hypothetical protein [Vibrio alginolyticus]|uniref:hypothetical protein n=1 Tax=Vibrio alginolyticus TaxID=663 RepID=UPI0022AB1DAE|nr:hypothetical protein [Vibrio alginolyticus]MCZ2802008.1 hypothetical protein [Vibrio alginolyticus]